MLWTISNTKCRGWSYLVKNGYGKCLDVHLPRQASPMWLRRCATKTSPLFGEIIQTDKMEVEEGPGMHDHLEVRIDIRFNNNRYRR